MTNLLITNLKKAFALTLDLVKVLDSEKLNAKIPNLRSNKIGEQFWCIIGARESFLKAIENGEWKGFSCSLKDCFSPNEIISRLEKTAIQLDKNLDSLNEKQQEFLLDLYTHEIQHHGQLIRFCYALEIDFPESWHLKYTV